LEYLKFEKYKKKIKKIENKIILKILEKIIEKQNRFTLFCSAED